MSSFDVYTPDRIEQIAKLLDNHSIDYYMPSEGRIMAQEVFAQAHDNGDVTHFSVWVKFTAQTTLREVKLWLGY